MLEATVIIVDNSEHSRNGDYLPSRFEAQSDAVNFIFSAKTQANAESSVGLMSMGATQPEVLTTLTTDLGKIIDGMHRTKIRGKSHFATALNVGTLALKHRQNKSQHQRIILFTCSPLTGPSDPTTADLVKLAKKLKKVNVAVDIVAFGSLDPETTAKLEAFHENIKAAEGSDDQSNLVVVPPGPNLLSDSLVSSPILAGDGVGVGAGVGGGASGSGGAGEGAGGGGDGFEFGVDPNADPELALALRMSMEEDERRRQREQREREETEGKQGLESVPEGQENAEASGSGGGGDGGGEPASGSNESGGEKKKDGEGDSGGDKMDTS